MDAIEFLIEDHKRVKTLFGAIEQGEAAPLSQEHFNQIYRMLSIHTTVEEQIFYPALAKYPEFHDLLEDAYKEHGQARLALSEIANLKSTDLDWKPKIDQLWHAMQHHFKDEEGEMFPKVRQFMEEAKLQELGQELQQARTSRLDSDLLSSAATVQNLNS